MRVMLGVSAFLAGCLILAAVWCNVLRTVPAPGQRPPLLMHAVLRWVPPVALALARTVPGRARGWVLDLIGPFVLFLVLACWLTALLLGFALIAVSFGGVPATPVGLAGWLRGADPAGSAQIGETEWRDDVVTLVAWANIGIVVLVFAAHLVCLVSAYSRRELVVSMLATQARRPPDAERLLVPYLRSGTTARLDDELARWARWLGDVQATHTACPALMFCRSSTSLNWLTAAVIMLDAAALMYAVAPGWAPPHTRTLLCTGAHCLQTLQQRIGIFRPPPVVSFEGREEVDFHHTLQEVAAAGLPAERDEAQASKIFQEWRIRYAPYAAAIAAHLLYDCAIADGSRFACEE
ncbi:MAG: hypothetical protein ACRDTC_03650 [Pseudonocardiaceae bacterium]